ncbi:hypothetical protein DyAD56_02340 [Dyella sp. AD56]|nr:hypothetical protein DyAD56_02340 [Dyella sp. AD56]
MPIPLRAFSSTPHRRTGGPKVKSTEPKARAAELHIASWQVAITRQPKAKSLDPCLRRDDGMGETARLD